MVLSTKHAVHRTAARLTFQLPANQHSPINPVAAEVVLAAAAAAKHTRSREECRSEASTPGKVALLAPLEVLAVLPRVDVPSAPNEIAGSVYALLKIASSHAGV